MSKRILIAAGGTGGHVYPAMGLAKQLMQKDPTIEIVFAAGGLANNRFFDKKFPFHSIESGTFTKKSVMQCLKSCKNIYKGFSQSRKILSEYKPQLVIGFGSYHTLPMLLAARLGKYPIALHEQNSKPGKVIRLFSKYALLTGVYFPSARSLLKGNSIELAMPLRDGFSDSHLSRENALRHYNLDPHKTTLLIFGGSQGSQFINTLITDTIEKKKVKVDNLQILHFTGDPQKTEQIKMQYEQAFVKAIVKDFEHQMELAWCASDLMISRAGAGTIAEQLQFGVPGILIPYPHAADNHQDSNADFLVETIGGGWKYLENELKQMDFSSILQPLLEKSNPILNSKKEALVKYKNNAARKEFATAIMELLGTGK